MGKPILTIAIIFSIWFSSCTVRQKIGRSAETTMLKSEAFRNAHLGICIYEPLTNKYWYRYQDDHYFIPASNTKIPTCYAAMKYLGDSLPGLKYGFADTLNSPYMRIGLQPTGDPTLLHPDFAFQPVWDFMVEHKDNRKYGFAMLDTIWKEDAWGKGWSWEDYDQTYMAERNNFPISANLLDIKLRDVKDRFIDSSLEIPLYEIFETPYRFFDSTLSLNFWISDDIQMVAGDDLGTPLSEFLHWKINRKINDNEFKLAYSNKIFTSTKIPFVTHGNYTARALIKDSLKLTIGQLIWRGNPVFYTYSCQSAVDRKVRIDKWNTIRTQPTDSVIKIMMHRSDNFYAEQTLLMVSNQLLGYMNDEAIIDTLLKKDFNDLPQKPRWVDGSGLSRYNLFSPNDFVLILNKMRTEFGMERVKKIFPTGNKGTLKDYFATDSNFIFAKTGTLSGVLSLSGYLYTTENKLLIFSMLVNNNTSDPTEIRRGFERFLKNLRATKN